MVPCSELVTEISVSGQTAGSANSSAMPVFILFAKGRVGYGRLGVMNKV